MQYPQTFLDELKTATDNGLATAMPWNDGTVEYPSDRECFLHIELATGEKFVAKVEDFGTDYVAFYVPSGTDKRRVVKAAHIVSFGYTQ